MKVLSLFDGMACGMIAMMAAGIDVDRYVAYEIDKYAIQTATHNFPMIEEKGDVFSADFTEYEGFDYLVGGSPCTYWSIAQTKNRETVASGMGWELFSQYVRALHEAKPKYFLYENNKSMSKAIRESITETFGFEPICINSALVSAQNRQRLYWVGIRQKDGTYKKADIEQPKDRGILLKDILETNYKTLSEKEMDYMMRDTKGFQGSNWNFCNKPAESDKSMCLLANLHKGVPYNVVAEPVNITEEGKAQVLKANYYKSSIANFCNGDGGMKYAASGVAEPVGCICHNIQQQVEVRKYDCDIDKLKELLRSHKNLSNNAIAEKLNKPVTLVEHWFRKDNCFAVPSADVWFELKELLNIDTTEFDDFVTVFEIRDGVYEKADRCYDVNGKYSTLTTANNDNIIEPIRVGTMPTNDGRITNSQANRIYSEEGKSVTIKAEGGGWGAKTGLYAEPVGTTKDGKNFALTAYYSTGQNAPHTLEKHIGSMAAESIPECFRVKEATKQGYVDIPMGGVR